MIKDKESLLNILTFILICFLGEIIIHIVKQKEKSFFNKNFQISFFKKNVSFKKFLIPETMCAKKQWTFASKKFLTTPNYCAKICGKDYISFANNNSLISDGIALPQSTFCVHNSVLHCNHKTHFAYISKTKTVQCIPKDATLLINDKESPYNSFCKSSLCNLGENKLNVFWDHLKNTPVQQEGFQINEMLKGSRTLRFSCRCNGKTQDGRFLSSSQLVPFHCFPDACKASAHSDTYFDIDAKKCICNNRTFNKYPFNSLSQCTDCSWRLLNSSGMVQGIIDCHSEAQKAEKINLIPCGTHETSSADSLCQKASLNISFF